MTTSNDQILSANYVSRCIDSLTGFVESIELADDTLSMLGCVRLVELGAAEARHGIVQLARAEGKTWQEIGDALGVSRQAAHERFGS